MDSDTIKPGVYEFENVGRNKACFSATIETNDDMFKAVRPHLMSSEIEFHIDDAFSDGRIIVGGFREVGKFWLVF